LFDPPLRNAWLRVPDRAETYLRQPPEPRQPVVGEDPGKCEPIATHRERVEVGCAEDTCGVIGGGIECLPSLVVTSPRESLLRPAPRLGAPLHVPTTDLGLKHAGSTRQRHGEPATTNDEQTDSPLALGVFDKCRPGIPAGLVVGRYGPKRN
jgi:hypothetical protein